MNEFFQGWWETIKFENELDQITRLEEKIKMKNSKYETNKGVYDFQQSKTIWYFDGSIFSNKIWGWESKKSVKKDNGIWW